MNLSTPCISRSSMLEITTIYHKKYKRNKIQKTIQKRIPIKQKREKYKNSENNKNGEKKIKYMEKYNKFRW